MNIINENEVPFSSSYHENFQNCFNPTQPNHFDSIPKNLSKSSNHIAFVVEWQMTLKMELPDK